MILKKKINVIFIYERILRKTQITADFNETNPHNNPGREF